MATTDNRNIFFHDGEDARVTSGDRKEQKKIDPKKLIVYSEIMRPKYDD